MVFVVGSNPAVRTIFSGKKRPTLFSEQVSADGGFPSLKFLPRPSCFLLPARSNDYGEGFQPKEAIGQLDRTCVPNKRVTVNSNENRKSSDLIPPK